MFSSLSLGVLHQVSSLLLAPVAWGLLFMLALAVLEVGIGVGERCGGIRAMGYQALLDTGRRRIERADFITRMSPMLGLMGTLIPLGPGLAALGEGDLRVLTTAMITAFDTTVIGLLAGMVGFVLARLRRRWYDQALIALAQADPLTAVDQRRDLQTKAFAKPIPEIQQAPELEAGHG